MFTQLRHDLIAGPRRRQVGTAFFEPPPGPVLIELGSSGHGAGHAAGSLPAAGTWTKCTWSNVEPG